MSVPKKRYGRRSFQQSVKRLRLRENVLFFIAQRAMHERHPVELDRTGRKVHQIFEIIRSKYFVRPDRGGASHWIEVAGVFEAAAGFLVVSANRDCVQRTDFI